MNDCMNSTGNNEWGTPKWLFDELDKEFSFTLDPCATEMNHKCDCYFTKKENGLLQDWSNKTVFCNPPYSRKTKKMAGQEDWIKKAYEEGKHTTVVMLIPSRTDTKAFHEYILGKAEIRFIKGRIKFTGAKYSAPFPSMIVIFRAKERSEMETNTIDKIDDKLQKGSSEKEEKTVEVVRAYHQGYRQACEDFQREVRGEIIAETKKQKQNQDRC